jgi:phospholipid/cholesterol/gamma-HCH transport system ATP-binding protein
MAASGRRPEWKTPMDLEALGLQPVPDEPPEAPPLVRFENVAMRFGSQQVLRTINMNLRRGQTTVVIGESGCGKTVMLKLIIGLLRPTEGQVFFDNRVLTDLSERELTKQRLRFGFLFQSAALFDSLTVFDNVAFPLREHTKKTVAEIQADVMQRLQEVGLRPGVEVKKPAELSGGMRKRVGLARAIVMNPEVMLYDEPTTGLDPIMSDVINDLIVQTRQRHGVTSIVVTHDMNTVRKVADRILMLHPLTRLEPNEGQIIFDGTSAELERCPDRRVHNFVMGIGTNNGNGNGTVHR